LISRALETVHCGAHHPGKPYQGEPSKPTEIQPSFLLFRLNFPPLRSW